MKKPIQSFNFFYSFFRPLVEFGTHCHYRRLVIKGRENLPKDGPYIYAPCHQNALMEPLVLLCVFSVKSIVFLARADIFKNPIAHKLLNDLKILPVYRIRDGKDNLGKNAEIFNQSCNVLLDRVPLCLMAEGRHNNQHHLLPLVKGMFRIAGDAQNKLKDTPLYIVPTGIDFDDYERPYSSAVVNIGKPIPVQQFMRQFNENEAIALNQMREELQEALMPMMHDIRNIQFYDELYVLANACNRTVRKQNNLRNTAWNRFEIRQRISRRLDIMVADGCEKSGPIVHLGKEYIRICDELHINPTIPSERWNLMVLILSTLGLAGIVLSAVWVKPVLHALLFWILAYPISWLPTHLLVKKIVKDTQFRSSFNCGIRFALSLIYVPTFSIIVGCHHGLVWGLISFAMAYLIAFFNRYIFCWLRGMFENWHYRFAQLIHRNKTAYLDTIVKEVSNSMKA